MRKTKYIAPLIALIFLMGCSTNRVVFNTLSSVKITKDEAVSDYFYLVAKKQASINGVPAVARAYDTFEAVFSAAVNVAQLNTNTVAPPQVLAAAGDVVSVITIAKGVK